MKIVFMGTPSFAVPSLESLYRGGHEIGFVVTKPDRQRDRGKKIKEPPVKEMAKSLGIPVMQPEKIKENSELYDRLTAYQPHVIVVVAYGMLLPEEILQMPSLGCINVHGSLLPKFRGAAPIQRAILSGEEKTGITIMEMDSGLDTGAMLSWKETTIGKKNNEELHGELSRIGAQLLLETLERLEKGEVKKVIQDSRTATYAPLITKEEGKLDFSSEGFALERRVQAFTPKPGAYTFCKGNRWKIIKGTALEKRYGVPEGTIVEIGREQVIVATKNSSFAIEEIQLSGKKPMKIQDYLRGNRIEKNCILG